MRQVDKMKRVGLFAELVAGLVLGLVVGPVLELVVGNFF